MKRMRNVGIEEEAEGGRVGGERKAEEAGMRKEEEGGEEGGEGRGWREEGGRMMGDIVTL